MVVLKESMCACVCLQVPVCVSGQGGYRVVVHVCQDHCGETLRTEFSGAPKAHLVITDTAG